MRYGTPPPPDRFRGCYAGHSPCGLDWLAFLNPAEVAPNLQDSNPSQCIGISGLNDLPTSQPGQPGRGKVADKAKLHSGVCWLLGASALKFVTRTTSSDLKMSSAHPPPALAILVGGLQTVFMRAVRPIYTFATMTILVETTVNEFSALLKWVLTTGSRKLRTSCHFVHAVTSFLEPI